MFYNADAFTQSYKTCFFVSVKQLKISLCMIVPCNISSLVLQNFYSLALTLRKAQSNICSQNNKEMFCNTDTFNQSYKTFFFVNVKQLKRSLCMIAPSNISSLVLYLQVRFEITRVESLSGGPPYGSTVVSCPYPELLDQTGKACQAQILQFCCHYISGTKISYSVCL